MPRTYCVVDENMNELDCVHPDDYDALVDELREIVAENERLRAANAGFREKNAELLSLIAKRMAERDEAQARLAEAEQLLREARQDVEYHMTEAECWDCLSEQGECIRRLERIDAFLAGTAESERARTTREEAK